MPVNNYFYKKKGFISALTLPLRKFYALKKTAKLVWGFTALEILIALAVVLILAAIVSGGFSSFRKEQILSGTAENIFSFVNEARAKTLSSKEDSVYGVHFENSRAVIFKGQNFSEGAPDNEIFYLPAAAEISQVSLAGGGAEAIFKRLTGETGQSGTVVIRLKGGTKTKTVVIQKSGLAEIN